MFHFLRIGNFRKFFQAIVVSILGGLLAGLAAAVFLFLLDAATNLRLENSRLILFLPAVGFFIGWLYWAYGKDVAGGNNLILEEIHQPKKIIPVRMAPLVFVGTVLTHLFGGSAGREGTAVQMGASLADQLTKLFKMDGVERRALLVAGAGAGFGAAIGAPWAGVIFGMEVIQVGRFQLFALGECLIASWVAYALTIFLRAPHSVYPGIILPDVSLKLIAIVIFSGMVFGLVAQLFIRLVHGIETLQKKIKFAPLKPFLGGFILLALYTVIHSYRYAGLGIETIQNSLRFTTTFADPVWKGILTAITVGTGFKGGEFIPLVFIGSTLGSAMAGALGWAPGFLAALGFAAVFGGAANTPIACAIMAGEIFGWRIVPYAFAACWLSFKFSGHLGIYRSQKYHRHKWLRNKKL